MNCRQRPVEEYGSSLTVTVNAHCEGYVSFRGYTEVYRILTDIKIYRIVCRGLNMTYTRAYVFYRGSMITCENRENLCNHASFDSFRFLRQL